jgi:N-acyl homoserine lactone hydrolase
LPRWNPFFTKQVIIKVAPLEEIGCRLQALGIDPARDIDAVLLTHFPHTRIIAPRESYLASRGLQGKLMGCLPQRWPIWLKPELVDWDGPTIGPFPGSHAVISDGSIAFVPTPGHSKGHASVIVRDQSITYFLAGDATYNEANLRAEKADGVTNNPQLSIDTLRKVKAFAAAEPTHILPAHDPAVPYRLACRHTYA